MTTKHEPKMPHFYFDLMLAEFRNQGGMILEDTACAFDRADQLATELCIVRPELRGSSCCIRVLDENGQEIYRTPIDAISYSNAANRR